jgi:hypothetical protein
MHIIITIVTIDTVIVHRVPWVSLLYAPQGWLLPPEVLITSTACKRCLGNHQRLPAGSLIRRHAKHVADKQARRAPHLDKHSNWVLAARATIKVCTKHGLFVSCFQRCVQHGFFVNCCL